MLNSLESSAIHQQAKPATEERQYSIVDRLSSIASISELLRIFGACAVIASMSLFLLEGWSEGNDISRYLKLLSQTGLLTAAGLVLSFVLKEYKGARLFFGLSIVSVVANFTILGALIYSMFQMDGGLIQYPDAVTWKAVSPALFWPVCLGAIAALSAISLFAYRIFARQIAMPLTLVFLGLNSLLLVPVRSSIAISLLIAIAGFAAILMTQRLRKKPGLPSTMEAKAAFATLFLPGFIIIARALSLYQIDEAMMLTLSALAYMVIRTLLARDFEALLLKRVMEIVQVCVSINIALLLVDILPQWNTEVLSFSLISLVLVADQIRGANKTSNWRSTLLNITTIMLVISNLGLAILSDTLVHSFHSLAVTAALLVFASYHKQSIADVGFSRTLAAMATAASLVILLLKLFALANLSNWIMIGILGFSLILAASFYERFALRLSSN